MMKNRHTVASINLECESEDFFQGTVEAEGREGKHNV